MRRLVAIAGVLILVVVLVLVLQPREDPEQPPKEKVERTASPTEVPVPIVPDGVEKGASPAFAIVSGRVLDEGGLAISGAQVELSVSTLRNDPVAFDTLETDETGNFRLNQLRRLAPNEYLNLVASKEGFVPERAMLLTARVDVEFRLRKAHPVVVKVVDQDGEPLAGITVRGFSGVRRPGLRTRIDGLHTTDENGCATLSLPTGPVSVAVWIRGYNYGSVKHEVVPGSTETVTLVLPAGVTIKGRVVEKESGHPISGVAVYGETEAPPVMTDSDGRFAATIQPSWQSLVFAAPWHFYGRRMPLNFRSSPPGSVVERVFELEPAGQVTGTVVDADGLPVAGAYVATNPAHANNAAHGSRSPAVASAVKSDREGRFHLKGVMPGKELTLHAEILGGPKGMSEPFTAGAGQVTRDVLVRLQKATMVVVVPVTEDGEIPDGCRATAFDRAQDDSRPPQFRRAAVVGLYRDGAIRLCCPTDGEYDITITARGYLPATVSLSEVMSAGCDEDSPFDVALERGLSIAGVCRGEGGKPLYGVAVIASSTVPGTSRQSTRTDEEGRFRITGLTAGEYNLSARGANLPGGRMELPGVAAGEEDVVFEFSSPCYLEGKFEDRSGRPLTGFVNAWKEPSPGTEPHDVERRNGYARGAFRMDMEPGEWWIGFRAQNGPTLRPVRITIREGKNVFPEQDLPQEYHRLAGTIQGPSGPIPNATVTVWPTGLPPEIERHFETMGQLEGKVTTGPKGRYVLGPLGPGKWKLTVTAPDHVAVSVEITVPAGGGEVAQDLFLNLAAFLSVEMKGPAGQRMYGTVQLLGASGERVRPNRGSKPSSERKEGFYLVGAFPPGEYSGEAVGMIRTADGKRKRISREVTVVLKAGEVTQLTVKFTQDEIDSAPDIPSGGR